MPLEGTLLGIVEEVYAAAEDPARWGAVIDRCARAVRCDAGALYAQDLSHGTASIAVAVGYGDSFLRSYEQYYAPRNPWTSVLSHFVEGEVQITDDLVPVIDFFESSEYYNDWLRPQGLFRAANLCLSKRSGLLSNVTLMRSKSTGEFAEGEVRLLSRLTPHLQRAVELHRRFSQVSTENQSMKQMLDCMPAAVIMVDRSGRVIYMNSAAERLIAMADGVSVQCGFVRLGTSSQDARLRQMLSDATNTASSGGQAGSAMRIKRRSMQTPFELLVTPIRISSPLMTQTEPSAAVFISDPGATNEQECHLWRDIYQLTDAEARIASELAKGRSLDEISGTLGITMNTTRTHMKAIFRKTDTHSQARLIRQMLRGVGEIHIS